MCLFSRHLSRSGRLFHSKRRSALFLGLQAGGPAAVWSSYLITIVFMMITAAVLAEICSALPLSGSIYIWAAESAGPKYARFFGFIVAWWACTAWMTFAASNCQVCNSPSLLYSRFIDDEFIRRLPIILSLKWLSGTSTFPEV